jgi:hypothetical protein
LGFPALLELKKGQKKSLFSIKLRVVFLGLVGLVPIVSLNTQVPGSNISVDSLLLFYYLETIQNTNVFEHLSDDIYYILLFS